MVLPRKVLEEMLGVWTIYWRVKVPPSPTPGGGWVQQMPIMIVPVYNEDDEAVLMATILAIEELL